MMTGAAPGWSSPGRNPRPTTGCTRSKSNRFAETKAPVCRSGRPSLPARFTVPMSSAASPISVVCCSCQTTISWTGRFRNRMLCSGSVVPTATIRSPSGKGRPLYMTPFTRLKTVVVSPIPRLSVTMMIRESPGRLSSIRTAKTRSLRSWSIILPAVQVRLGLALTTRVEWGGFLGWLARARRKVEPRPGGRATRPGAHRVSAAGRPVLRRGRYTLRRRQRDSL